MRRAAKIDANQPLIVKALRDAGCTVQHLHGVGQGCPDLLVGFRGRNFLMEIKDPSRKPSERKLSDDEKLWHGAWNGQVQIVETVEEALGVIGDRERA
jgi:hypothetical protein